MFVEGGERRAESGERRAARVAAARAGSKLIVVRFDKSETSTARLAKYSLMTVRSLSVPEVGSLREPLSLNI